MDDQKRRAKEWAAADLDGPPWKLTRSELETLAEKGFTAEVWDEILDTAADPPVPRLRVVWRAPEGLSPGAGPPPA